MTNYTLILKSDGDIEIWKDDNGIMKERIYHKSYNLGDDLKENLLKAYEYWENCYDN